MRRIAAAVSTALLPTLLAGCVPAPAAALPDDVSVGIRQNRDDYGPRRLEVLVANGGGEALEVWEARLDSPAFVDPAWTPRPTTVRAGTTTALRLQLPEPDCGGDDSAGRIRLAWTTADSSGTSVVEPEDPFGTLARVHEEDCLAQRLAEVVTIEPADGVTVTQEPDGPVAHLALTVTPTGAPGAVRIAEVRGTILLRPASGDVWPVGVRVDADSEPLVLDLAIVPVNCSTHTVAEDKRGTFFPVVVAPEGGAEGVVPIGVSDAVRGELYEFIAEDFCGWS
ncbi:hypothetical protein [Rathayibacter sp. VKM Ac-2630]|uniref:hypothetical protein n=1 Tax=Rathayibacter sp. VKM Ac-2630 TaxID=1938617 RepID=UPI0009820AB4|nr:hypothetical protein [Rathayibacter sp. VKM Ac-2630]OOB91808.1 hypothetical protein B0T42_03445 [Rathayibacter sp. VKM Ac-2630]